MSAGYPGGGNQQGFQNIDELTLPKVVNGHWMCFKCNLQNPEGNIRCQCGFVNVALAPSQSSVQQPQAPQVEETYIDPRIWKCSNCSYEYNMTDICGKCRAPNPNKAIPQASLPAQQSYQPVAYPSASFPVQQNAQFIPHRHLSHSIPAVQPPQYEQPHTVQLNFNVTFTRDGWVCKNCQTVNDFDNNYCKTCQQKSDFWMALYQQYTAFYPRS